MNSNLKVALFGVKNPRDHSSRCILWFICLLLSISIHSGRGSVAINLYFDQHIGLYLYILPKERWTKMEGNSLGLIGIFAFGCCHAYRQSSPIFSLRAPHWFIVYLHFSCKGIMRGMIWDTQDTMIIFLFFVFFYAKNKDWPWFFKYI